MVNIILGKPVVKPVPQIPVPFPDLDWWIEY